MNSRHKGPVLRNAFQCHDVMTCSILIRSLTPLYAGIWQGANQPWQGDRGGMVALRLSEGMRQCLQLAGINHFWLVGLNIGCDSCHNALKGREISGNFHFFKVQSRYENQSESMGSFSKKFSSYCPACRTTFIATRFRVAVICPIIPVPHCIRVFFYFVWFVFINHIFQFYYELCTYCNILDIYLS